METLSGNTMQHSTGYVSIYLEPQEENVNYQLRGYQSVLGQYDDDHEVPHLSVDELYFIRSTAKNKQVDSTARNPPLRYKSRKD